MTHGSTTARTHLHRPPTEGFRSIFVVLFLVFLVVALASTLCLQNWRTVLPGAESARGLLDGVSSAVWTVLSQLS